MAEAITRRAGKVVRLERAAVLRRLERALRPMVAAQASGPRDPRRGAFINPEWGLDDASHVGTGAMVAGCAVLALDGPVARRPEWARRAEWGVAYLRRVQRRSGLIDLRACNFDSAPDTAFVVQLLGAVEEAAARRSAWPRLREEIERFVARAVPGLARGGFHTPNHRWVIAAALAWAGRLWPRIRQPDTVAAYVAEGVDQDGDGAYQERSAAVYDAVTNRSLWILARHAGWREGAAAIGRNLRLNLALLHADGTIESGLSRRQDCTWRVVPTSLVAPYWLAAVEAGDAGWAGVASRLWKQSRQPSVTDAFWTWYALEASGCEEVRADAEVAEHVTWLPALQAWRRRWGRSSLTVFGGSTRLLHLVHGAAELVAASVSQSYFGTGRFAAASVRPGRAGVELALAGLPRPRRPGYDLPLGEPVPVEAWEERAAARPWRAMPKARGVLRVAVAADGCELHYRSRGGMAGVPAQIALDFAAGGVWVCGGRRRRLRAGEVVLLEEGWGEMGYGRDRIRVGPGAAGHRMLRMRDAEPLAAGCVRVVVPLITPAEHQLRLEW